MTAIELEEYCFMRLYAIDFDRALNTIKILRRHKRVEVQQSLVRDIAVTYARPFSGNRGDQVRKHQLTSRQHVPNTAKDLHKELVRLRMQQFAHTDMKFYRPRVAKFRGGIKPWFPMSFKGYDYGPLLRQMAEVENLVREVERSIQAVIATYEKDF